MGANKSIEKQVNALMEKAQGFVCGSAEQNNIVLQICRLYDPVRFPVFDESAPQLDF